MDILVYFYLHPTATRNEYILSDVKISEGGTISSITRLQELELLKLAFISYVPKAPPLLRGGTRRGEGYDI